MHSIAPFVSSSDEAVKAMLRIANIKKGELLFDLGSGDGKVLIAAFKHYGVKAVGIEIREDLFRESLIKIQELGLQENIKIIHGDLLDGDYRKADVVTLYLTTSANEKVAPKLERDLKPGCRVVSHQFQIPNWKPTIIDSEGNSKIYLYVR